MFTPDEISLKKFLQLKLNKDSVIINNLCNVTL